MDITKIKIGDAQYNIKDTEARQSIANLQLYATGGMHYIGETSTPIADGDTTSVLVPEKQNSLLKTTGFAGGDIVAYGELEFIWNGASWHEFGSTGSLKALAFKNNATGDITCSGTNSPSSVNFSGTTTETVLKAINAEAVAPTFTEGAFTPATYEHTGFDGGSLGNATTSNFATSGVTATVDETNELLTLVAAPTSSAVTAQGTFTPASYGTDTFTGGSKAQDTFTPGSAATFTTQSVITGLGTATAAAQTFSGATVSVTVD